MAISPKLPLGRDWVYGYGMNTTIKDTVQQNLTNLLLTIPGERAMDPDFGVGLKKYLFEPVNAMVSSHIEGRIREQVAKYMGFIGINNIFVGDSREVSNLIHLTIDYTIVPLNLKDQISLETTI